MKHLPNILTLLRLALLPVIIMLLFKHQPWAVPTALTLYIIACLTDYLDGFIARQTKNVSAFGTFLDPVADKIFIASLLLTLTAINRLEAIWIVPALVILVREFTVSGLREYLGPKNVQIPVSMLAKCKTAIQMLALGVLIYGGPYLMHGRWALAVAAVLTVVTGFSYLKAGLKHME